MTPEENKGYRAATIEQQGQEWILWHRNHADQGEWWSIVLEAPWESRHNRRYPQKKWFWLGWNGTRLAEKKDTQILKKRHFEIYCALIAKCERLWPPMISE